MHITYISSFNSPNGCMRQVWLLFSFYTRVIKQRGIAYPLQITRRRWKRQHSGWVVCVQSIPPTCCALPSLEWRWDVSTHHTPDFLYEPHERGTISVPILQMRKGRLEEVKEFIQGQGAIEKLSQDLISECLCEESSFITFSLLITGLTETSLIP